MTRKLESDEELAAVRVSGVAAPHNAKIDLAPYDPTWPAQYAAEAAKIRSALGEAALVLEHIGSTSIPGVSAKPIIDILLAVADSSDEAAYVPALTAQGYHLHLREPDWEQHRLMKGERPDLNLHVFTTGEGSPYGLALVPVVKVSSRTALAEKWHDLIDIDAGRIATGHATIEDVGWGLFRYILEVASGRKKTWAEHWRLANALSPFNPGPVA